MIDGYTASEWCEDGDLILVISQRDDSGKIVNKTEWIDHYKLGEPTWPDLEANGDEWEIIDKSETN